MIRRYFNQLPRVRVLSLALREPSRHDSQRNWVTGPLLLTNYNFRLASYARLSAHHTSHARCERRFSAVECKEEHSPVTAVLWSIDVRSSHEVPSNLQNGRFISKGHSRAPARKQRLERFSRLPPLFTATMPHVWRYAQRTQLLCLCGDSRGPTRYLHNNCAF